MLFECIIATPVVVHKENVYMVTLPGVEGKLGILANHAPMMVMLEGGEIDFYESGTRKIKRFKTKEGYAHITSTFCHVYVQDIEEIEGSIL